MLSARQSVSYPKSHSNSEQIISHSPQPVLSPISPALVNGELQGVPCCQLTLCFSTGHGHGHDDGILPLHLHHSGNVPPGPTRKGRTSLNEGHLTGAWTSLPGIGAIVGRVPNLLKALGV